MSDAYISKLTSTMNALRTNGEFTDVTLACEDGGDHFKCHRFVLAAASDYFKVMFAGSFKESTEERIVLREVSTATLREVLRFIYTGNAEIHYESLWDMFGASEFFQLPDLLDLCITFVSQNKHEFDVKSFLEVYLYAYRNKKNALTDIITSDLVARLELFSKAEEFLEVPFDALKGIVNARLSSSTLKNSDEVVLAAISRWVGHGGTERMQYYSELRKLVSYGNISPPFTEYLADNLFTSTVKSLPRFNSSVSLVPLAPDAYNLPKTLHLYVRYAAEDVIRIFSIGANSNDVCNLTGEIFQNNSEQAFTTVELNDFFIHRLRYFGEGGVSSSCETAQTFFAHTSADMQMELPLKRPPVCFEKVSLCAVQSNIYAYHETLPSDPVRTVSLPNSRSFDDQEIVRGIYAYNSEVDDWFPVPATRRRMHGAAMTALDNTVFLIGGGAFEDMMMEYVQAYDIREGIWRELPRTQNDYFGAPAWCQNGKIYVAGGSETKTCERYDAVAGKWERLMDLPDGTVVNPKAVLYGLGAWFFSRDDINVDVNGRLNYQTGIELYYMSSHGLVYQWCQGSFDLNFENPTNMVDCVVFKHI